jgi:hypothetical protein
VQKNGLRPAFAAHLLTAGLALDRTAYDSMIRRPHVVARFEGAPPAQRALATSPQLFPVEDGTWSDAMALAALTPLRALYSFGSGMPAGDPCYSSKWRPGEPQFADHVVDIVSAQRRGSLIWYDIGGPPVAPEVTADGFRAGKVVFCPPELDGAQCFEATR